MGDESEKLARSINNSIDGCATAISWCIAAFIIFLLLGGFIEIARMVASWLS